MPFPSEPSADTSALSQDITLANGRAARMVMPDMIALADGRIDIPHSAQADVYELIYGGRSVLSAAEELNANRKRARGLYALASLVLTDPASGDPLLSLDDDDRTAAQLAPRQIAWGDLELCYTFFRFGPPFMPAAPAANQGPDPSAEPAPDSAAVPPSAE